MKHKTKGTTKVESSGAINMPIYTKRSIAILFVACLFPYTGNADESKATIIQDNVTKVDEKTKEVVAPIAEIKKEEKITAETQTPKAEETPEIIKDKLTIGLAVGFGFGRLIESTSKMDGAAYHVTTAYKLMPAPILPDATWVAAFHLRTFSGIDSGTEPLENESRALSIRAWTFGGGLETSLTPYTNVPGLRAQGLGLLSIAHERIRNIAQSKFEASKYGVGIGLQGEVFYQIVPKIEATSSLTLVVGSFQRYELTFGLAGTF